MFKGYDLKCQLVLAVALLSTISITGFSMEVNDPNEILQKRLAEISVRNKGKETDLTKLETDCLALIQDYNSPAQKGKIYAEIAKTYSKKGFDGRNDVRITKAVNYCKKALEQPLDVITACEMHGRLTDSMIVSFRTLPQSQFVELRREAVVFCLNGFKIALDNNAPKEQQPSPAVGIYNIEPNDPDYKKVMEKYQAELADQKKWEFESKLYFQRQVLTELCVCLYSHKPYDTDELEKFARDSLRGHEDVVDELMAKVHERISQQGNK
ncbi:MAG: hypothetical protein JXB29_07975 [Sedimentisphaerales bacterium]|nr:hypothetical protein [Sedimentisphaerales bacterium]